MKSFTPLFLKKNNKSSQKGFALLLVIMVMLLVSFLAMQLVMDVRTETKVAFNVKSRITGLFLAEAGINLGYFWILRTRLSTGRKRTPNLSGKGRYMRNFFQMEGSNTWL